MKNLHEKIEKMETDIRDKFDKVNLIKGEFETKRKKLIRERDELKNYKASIVEEVK